MVDTAGHFPFSDETRRSCWHEAMCKPSPSGCKFNATGQDGAFLCGLERDTQRQIWHHMPVDSIVLEVGSRYGTVSCTISKRQRYSGMRVSVEPDQRAFNKFLTVNVRQNGCAGKQARGVVDNMRASFKGGTGFYGRVAAPDASGGIPAWSIPALQKKLPRGPGGELAKFSVLVLDCEGCAFRFIQVHEPFMRSPALRQVYLEADWSDADPLKSRSWEARYKGDFVARMCDFGFDLLAVDPNLTGFYQKLADNPMYHVVFQRGGRCQKHKT